MYRVIHYNDAAFTDAHWQHFYDLMVTLKDKYRAAFSQTSWQEMKERVSILESGPIKYHMYLIYEGERLFGYGEMWMRDPGTPQMAGHIALNSLGDAIPADFARVVSEETLKLLNIYECGKIYYMTPNARISDAVRLMGGRELNRVDRYRLYRKDANVDVIKNWLETIPKENQDLTLEFFDPVPERYLQQYVDTFQHFIEDMPKEKDEKPPFTLSVDFVRKQIQWRKENDAHIYTYALINSEDRMVAHSNVSVNGKNPRDAYQAMTGIEPEYRGRGLSKWLKGELFFKVGRDYPENEMFTSDMRAINEPILAVNRQMGYVLEGNGHEFELTVDSLRKSIAS